MSRANTQRRFDWVRKTYPDPPWIASMTARIVLGHHIPGTISRTDENEYIQENVLQVRGTRPVDPWIPWVAREVKRILNTADILGIRGGYTALVVLESFKHHFDRIRDWFLATHPDIGRFNFRDAISAQAAWHKELAARIREGLVKQAPVFLRFRDGWTWQELTPEHLHDEGEAMGHCVGRAGYQEAIAAGRSRILSLRDKQGKPHVTVEFVQGTLRLDKWYLEQVQGKGDTFPAAHHHKCIRTLLRAVLGPASVWPENALLFLPERLLWRLARTRWTHEELRDFDASGGLLAGLCDFMRALGDDVRYPPPGQHGAPAHDDGFAIFTDYSWKDGELLLLRFQLQEGRWAHYAKETERQIESDVENDRDLVDGWQNDHYSERDARDASSRGVGRADEAARRDLESAGIVRDGLDFVWSLTLPARTRAEDWTEEKAHALVLRKAGSIDRYVWEYLGKWQRYAVEELREVVKGRRPGGRANRGRAARPVDLSPAERFAHGTRARYVSGCRCADCKASNVRAYHERQRRLKEAARELPPAPPAAAPQVWTPPGGEPRVRIYKRACPGVLGEPCSAKAHLRRDSGGACKACRAKLLWDGLVDTGPAREHIRALSRQGVGRDAVADASGVARSTIQAISAGRNALARASTLRRILAVDVGALADKALVPATETWTAIRELQRFGLTKGDIALALGATRPVLQLQRDKVTVRNAWEVAQLLRRTREEAAVHAAGSGFCEVCSYAHGRERLTMLGRLEEPTWEVVHVEWPCVYPDTPLGRRRFTDDTAKRRRR